MSRLRKYPCESTVKQHILRYSRKFSHGAKFHVFRGWAGCCEILNGQRNSVMSYMQLIGVGVVSSWRRHENKNHENFSQKG